MYMRLTSLNFAPWPVSLSHVKKGLTTRLRTVMSIKTCTVRTRPALKCGLRYFQAPQGRGWQIFRKLYNSFMRYAIFHWYGDTVEKQVPEATLLEFSTQTGIVKHLGVEIEDLQSFMIEHSLKAVIVFAPNENDHFPSIALNDKGRAYFGQR